MIYDEEHHMKNLTNQKFGKLTAIEKGPSVLSGKNLRSTWNCKCDCGNYKIIRTRNLLHGGTKSCGCLYKEFGRSFLPGQKINRLTTISYKNKKWTCVCDCGNTIVVKTETLTTGNTKSCGCLKSESSKNPEKLEKMFAAVRKYEPRIASARRVWKQYCYRDKNCSIEFDDFLLISQNNCEYCGCLPNNTFNLLDKPNGTFIYNGLDRINSTKSHTLNNVIACCYSCNKAKNNSTVEEFLQRISGFEIKQFQYILFSSNTLPEEKSQQTSIRSVFYNYKKDSDLNLEEFYFISQLPCFYCNQKNTNIFNRAKSDKKSSQIAKDTGNFYYNGLDRIDSFLSHNKHNIVPCCKFCNFAKGKKTLEQYQEWMTRIMKFHKEKALKAPYI